MKMMYNDTDSLYEPEDGLESSFEDIDATEGNLAERVATLKQELKAVQKERKEYLDGWQRAKADYLNSQKRFEEERGDIKKRAEMSFIEKILPLADSFSMALDGLKESDGGDGNAWKLGLMQIHAQLATVMKALGVSEVGEIGEDFNPHLHEALGQEKTEESMQDTVVKILQKGYLYRDTVIRPAKVIIGTA